MKEYDLRKILENQTLLQEKIIFFLDAGIITKESISSEEVRGHILKAENTLRFISENIQLGFLDWSITGCYYASYHAALALILTKGYFSRNHLATLCILIKEFYKKGLDKEDIEMLSKFLDYHDIMFYVESKNKREDATYSTRLLFDKKEVEDARLKAVLFVNKIKGILLETKI